MRARVFDRWAQTCRLIRRPSDLVLLGRMIRYASRAPMLAADRLHDLDAGSRPRRVIDDPARADAVERLLPVALAAVRRKDCLPRGLTAYHFLRGAGRPVALVFGVRGGHQPSAHCWLELSEQPYLERGQPRQIYTVMHTIGPD